MHYNYLNPSVFLAQIIEFFNPLINYINDIIFGHQRNCQIGFGMETHDTTGTPKFD